MPTLTKVRNFHQPSPTDGLEDVFVDALESSDIVLGKGDLKTDAWGNQKVTQLYSLVHGLFTFDIPATQWLLYENGSEISTATGISNGSIYSSSGMAVIDSSGTNAQLVNRRHARYQPNRGIHYSVSIIHDSPNNDGVRDWGLFTPTDGLFFRLKPKAGVGTLYVVRRYNSVETEVEVSMPFTLDYSKGNIFDIQAQWRGVGNVKFFAGNPSTGTLEHIHTFSLLGTLTTLSTRDSALCVGFKSTYTTQDVVMRVGCVDLSSEGGGKDTEEYASIYSSYTTYTGTGTGATAESIIAIKQPDTINSQLNTRDIRLARITVNCDKKAEFFVFVTRDSSAVTGATFVALGNGSYVEHDSPTINAGAVRATNIDTTKCRFVTAIPVNANTRSEVTNPSRETIQFFLVHGDYLIVTCTATSANPEVVVEWGEEI
jgi:hypothetical protein